MVNNPSLTLFVSDVVGGSLNRIDHPVLWMMPW